MYGPKKTAGRGRRFASRRWRPAAPKSSAHSFTRVAYLQNYITTPGAGGGGAISFQLNQLPSSTDFTSLFDQYMIEKVVLQLVPSVTEIPQDAGGAALPAASAGYSGMLHTVLDFDDNTSPTGSTELMEYDNVKSTRWNEVHTRVLTPAVAREMYRSAATTGYGQATHQWIDAAYPDVPHYGVKFWVDGFSTAVTPSINFHARIKYYLKMKNVR